MTVETLTLMAVAGTLGGLVGAVGCIVALRFVERRETLRGRW